MKQLLWSSIIVALALVNIVVQAASTPAGPTKTTIHGIIIDNHCAAANKDSLTKFIRTHTKECVLTPSCEASGYSIYTNEGELHPFLHRNTAAIAGYLKVPANSLQVTVTVEAQGDSLKLETIKGEGSVKPAEKQSKKTM